MSQPLWLGTSRHPKREIQLWGTLLHACIWMELCLNCNVVVLWAWSATVYLLFETSFCNTLTSTLDSNRWMLHSKSFSATSVQRLTGGVGKNPMTISSDSLATLATWLYSWQCQSVVDPLIRWSIGPCLIKCLIICHYIWWRHSWPPWELIEIVLVIPLQSVVKGQNVILCKRQS